MTDNPDVRAQTENRKNLSSKKIEELRQLLSSSNGSSPSETARELTCSDLAATLFDKASVDFLERKTLEDLAKIVKRSDQALQQFLGSDELVHITTKRLEHYTAINIVLADRPFIISSISECLVAFGSSILALYHPIIIEDGQRISLSYIEISPLSEEQLGILVRRLQRAISHVALSTEDYTAMLVRAETVARILGNPKYPSPFPTGERREVASFLRWLTDGGFIFLGHLERKVSGNEQLEEETAASFGVFRSENLYSEPLLEEISHEMKHLLERKEQVVITKLRSRSLVHRRLRLLSINLPEHSSTGALVGIHSFVGLLTSRALSQESSSVPLIRQKLQSVLKAENAIENSHDYKNIVDIVDSMPKDEALSLDIESLRGIVHTALAVQDPNETQVSIRFDRGGRGASVLIVMPRDRFNTHVRHQLQKHIEQVFGASAGSSEYYLDLSAKPHARFYFHVMMPGETVGSIDLPRLRSDIADLTRTWRDNLEGRISSSDEYEDPASIWYCYADAFGPEYQAMYSVSQCETDISYIQQISRETPVGVGMAPAPQEGPDFLHLTVYHSGTEITISQALPIFENAGFEVINEQASRVDPRGAGTVFVHRFLVRVKSRIFINQDHFKACVAPGLAAIFNGNAEDDTLNSLMISASLPLEAIALLRTYCGLLWQVNKFATRSSILETLAETPSLASQLWEMFETRFAPEKEPTSPSREIRFRAARSRFRDGLRDVSDITRDRILRSLMNLMKYTVRTNFYSDSPAIALKIHSEEVEIMPHPRPMYECYVRSQSMEGVHLRSSKIARGGIRWSDRLEDYRSEVLGLMKTQKVKNALIVPSGAKGGFIVRDLPEDRDAARFAVERAYKDFIISLLSVSDNQVGGETVRPRDLVIYDEEDTYFVVAADKGTATYSDMANGIAENFQFWLKDAFASGGSNGYDHKLYGITAKGAWVCVERHFKNIRLDHEKVSFTAVGIGDMSGDVFGNGLLLSKTIKLLAAFNHKHIFIDPDPDPQRSFEERTRLFETPGTQWSDYSEDRMSAGGGIYGRFDKEITLSPQARTALGISDDVPQVLNGEQIIALILKAPVDLLWNGGIGTYVKSKFESHSDVNDGTNDRVRVKAHELRCKIVGEGGNLGFTQRARIEFAQAGGCINTDAIDNSGGVDLSDHEVNLKILFERIIEDKRLTLEKRNELLKEIASEVVSLVLENNRQHALLLTVGIERSKRNIEYFRSLIRDITKMGYIDRTIENLPEDEELIERAIRREGLCAPELAVCVAAVKLWTKEVLLETEWLDTPLLESYLLEYFPERIRKLYPQDILAHPLRRHIVATQLTNSLVNAIGITFIHRMCLSYSVGVDTVVKCALAAEMLLKTPALREEFRERFDNFEDMPRYLNLTLELNDSLREATAWLLRTHAHRLSLAELVDRYQQQFETLIASAGDLFVGEAKEIYQLRLGKYTEEGLSEHAASSMAAFPRIMSLLEMLWTARQSSQEVDTVAHTFSLVMQELQVHSLLAMENSIEPQDKWQNELLVLTYDEIRRSISNITLQLLKAEESDPEVFVELLRRSETYEPLMSMIAEVKEKSPSVAAISVLSRHLGNFEIRP